jgi:hypothetical protein
LCVIFRAMLTCIPELTVPIPSKREDVVSLHTKVDALFKTAEFLEAFGAPTEATDEDKVRARSAFHESVSSAEATNVVTPLTNAVTTTASVMHLKSILSEYDQVVVNSAVQIRTYVTNKLIEETTHPDPKIRIRALELLGKVGDVGLFIERSEITVKHKTTLELEASIKGRISKLLELRSKSEKIVDVVVKPKTLQESKADVLSTPTLVRTNINTDD